MLTKRIIPCLDIDRGRVVKGVSFVNIRDAGDPAELARFYDSQGADELVFLDITASSDARDIIIDVVRLVSEQVFIPLTVGGGLRTVADVRRMLEAGADKASLNTAAVANPALIAEASEFFGAQCIVVAIDAKRVDDTQRAAVGEWSAAPSNGAASADVDAASADIALDAHSRWQVYVHGGRTPTGIDAVKWAQKAAELGAGELLVTSMDTDGQQTGYDLQLLRAISETATIPLIASGGAGSPQHLHDALAQGKADAVLAASIFHYGTHPIPEVKRYLASKGVPIRPSALSDDPTQVSPSAASIP